MKKIQLFILNCLIIALSSCDSFLDIVPDDIATIDNAFTMRAQAEKYLFTCYYYLPAHGLLEANPAIAGGDELILRSLFVVQHTYMHGIFHIICKVRQDHAVIIGPEPINRITNHCIKESVTVTSFWRIFRRYLI